MPDLRGLAALAFGASHRGFVRAVWWAVMARKHASRNQSGRVAGQFIALPHDVIDSAGYRAVSHVARSLLIDIARQYNRHNNGSFVATPKYLHPLGWKSNDTITKALRQLIAHGLVIETRKGRFPNTAAWFACTWWALDVTDGLDIDPRSFRTGTYRGDALIPSAGARPQRIAPSHGIRAANVAPRDGTMRPDFDPAPIPGDGEYLDKAICTGGFPQ